MHRGVIIGEIQRPSGASNIVKPRNTSFSFLICLFLVASCAGQKEYRAEFFVFGTVLEVITWGETEEQAEAAFTALQAMFQSMHRDWHAWEPGMLTEINLAFASGHSAVANDQIIELIRRSQQIELLSGGRFNPAIGALIGLWGFHTSDFPIMGPPPTRLQIQEILDHAPSTRDITINDHSLETDNPFVQLDFGGIAKGYAIDLACDKLRELGIENAVVNAGGDLRAFGEHGSRPWRLGIRSPVGGIIGGVEAAGDEAIFTSGVYERYRQDGDERYPHILDPATGWPVNELSSVTVIAGEGLLADAAATALIIAGKEHWSAVAGALGLDKVLLVDESGQVYLTPAMAKRVEFVRDVHPLVVDPDAIE